MPPRIGFWLRLIVLVFRAVTLNMRLSFAPVIFFRCFAIVVLLFLVFFFFFVSSVMGFFGLVSRVPCFVHHGLLLFVVVFVEYVIDLVKLFQNITHNFDCCLQVFDVDNCHFYTPFLYFLPSLTSRCTHPLYTIIPHVFSTILSSSFASSFALIPSTLMSAAIPRM